MYERSAGDYDFTGVGGWISPEGRFVNAYYGGHEAAAADILQELCVTYSRMTSPSTPLIDLGWIRLETEGYVHHPFHPSPAQVDWFFWIFQHSRPSMYQEEISLIVNRILNRITTKEVFPRVPAQGDQENMRKGH